MRHPTHYPLSAPTTVARSPLEAGGAWAVYGLLAVSAFVGFVVLPGGQLLALLMVLAAGGWLLWALLWAAGSVIKRLIVAAAAIGRHQADGPGRVAVSGRRSSPSSLHQGQLGRSEV